MFNIFISEFLKLSFLRVKGAALDDREFSEDDDLDLCIYYLRTMANVFRWAPDAIWGILATKTLSSEDFPGLSEISELLLLAPSPGGH